MVIASDTGSSSGWAGSLARWRIQRRRAGLARRRIGSRRATLRLLATLLLLGVLVLWSFLYLRPAAPGREITLHQLSAAAEQKQVATARLLDEDSRIVVTLLPEGGAPRPAPAPGAPAATPSTPSPPAKAYWAAYPKSDTATSELIRTLTAASARVSVDSQSAKSSVRILLTVLLPLMILANLFALFFTVGKGGAAGLGEVVNFASLGGRRVGGGSQRMTFGDVAGVDEALVELREIVEYLKSPEKFQRLGASPPKGVLLYGPPGCGKTLLARAVAGEAGVPFFSVAGTEFVESLVGVGAARVRDLFAQVKSVAPAIVFLDELDAAGRRRGAAVSGGSDERDQTLNQLLTEMDGFDVSSGIVVIGATNRPDIIDPALLRPGRFDRHITVTAPDLERREAILRLHARQRRLAPDVDFARLARQTPGFSGADLANVVNEAALLAIRKAELAISAASLSEAVQRVLSGPQRRGHLLTEDERRRVAYHEAGHALMSAATGDTDRLLRVSILSRGRGLGNVTARAEDDATVLTYSQMRARLVRAMAGTAAEDIAFDEASTGVEDDLERATAIARDMVGRLGMSPAVGRVRLLGRDVEEYLGVEAELTAVSESTLTTYDAEVRRLIEEAHATARRVLEAHPADLDALVDHLIEHETLEGEELLAAVAAAAAWLIDADGKAAPRRHS